MGYILRVALLGQGWMSLGFFKDGLKSKLCFHWTLGSYLNELGINALVNPPLRSRLNNFKKYFDDLSLHFVQTFISQRMKPNDFGVLVVLRTFF